MKVVKPINKDFTQDLADSKEQGVKPRYDLGEVPPALKTFAKNLGQQLSAYASGAFDALFGGVPGSLPRTVESPVKKPEEKIRNPSEANAPANRPPGESTKRDTETLAKIADRVESRPPAPGDIAKREVVTSSQAGGKLILSPSLPGSKKEGISQAEKESLSKIAERIEPLTSQLSPRIRVR